MARSGGLGTAESKSAVVFHADDFGETIEITRGIIRAIEGGVLKSTTILANMPGSEFGVARALELADQASFGVHINLCEGRPLTSANSLSLDNGSFVDKKTLVQRAVTGGLDSDELRREIDAQVGFVVSQGVDVSHLDGHKHLHLLPGVREAVVRTAKKFDISRVRVTAERSSKVLVSPSRTVREMFAGQAARVFKASNLRFPDRIRDLAQYLGRSMESFAGELENLRGLTEVVSHPGTVAADREKPGSCTRSRELEYLIQPGLKQELERRGLGIVSYWEV